MPDLAGDLTVHDSAPEAAESELSESVQAYPLACTLGWWTVRQNKPEKRFSVTAILYECGHRHETSLCT